MIRPRFFLTFIFGFSFTYNMLEASAIALDPESIRGKAAHLVVKIGGDYGGTGFFVRKNNNRCTILTNRHVIENSSTRIITVIKPNSLIFRTYTFSDKNIRLFPGLDLAEVEIEIDSKIGCTVAKLNNKDAFTPGGIVYTYGFNAIGKRFKSRDLQWLEGKITGQSAVNRSSEGYSLAYTLPLIHGLSGSPLFNEDGEVIGIYGSGEEGSVGLGIPISTYRNIALSSPSTVIDRTPVTSDQNGKTLISIVSGNKNFTTLVRLLKAADLIDLLSSEGRYTLLAPTNAAFAKIPKDTIANLLKPENKEQLKKVLNYHILPNVVTSSLMRSGRAPRFRGSPPFQVSDTKITFENANVILVDVKANNGVIHVLDTVLLPPN